jgi:hypothetical protein
MVAYFGEVRAREARTETKRFRTFGEDVPPSRPQTRRRYIIQESWANHNLLDLPALCAGGCDAVGLRSRATGVEGLEARGERGSHGGHGATEDF